MDEAEEINITKQEIMKLKIKKIVVVFTGLVDGLRPHAMHAWNYQI